MFKLLKNKKGVTLVELLAVVVILGIIAAIAVPTIGGLIARQQANADRATFTSIEQAAITYATAENDSVFTLADLENADYIDLKTNTFSLLATDGSTPVTAKANIYIKVTGSTVTIHAVEAANDTIFSLSINNTVVYPSI